MVLSPGMTRIWVWKWFNLWNSWFLPFGNGTWQSKIRETHGFSWENHGTKWGISQQDVFDLLVNHDKSMVNPYISYDLRPCKSWFSANVWWHPPHLALRQVRIVVRGPGKSSGRGASKGDVYWFRTPLIDHSTYIKLYKWTPPLYDII